MNIPNKQIENFKMYGYHITTTNKLKMIKNEGLLPKCEERSKAIGDSREAIYFFPVLLLINNWIDLLYGSKNRESLELLRIDLKKMKRRFTISDHNPNNIFGDWYTLDKITPDNLEYLKRINQDKEVFYLENLLENEMESLIWRPINLWNENEQYLKK